MQMEKTPREEIVVILSSADQKAFGVSYSALSFSDRRTRRFCEQLAVLICLQEGVPESGDISVRAAENAGGELLLYFSLPPKPTPQTYAALLEFDSADGLLDCRSAFRPLSDLVTEVYFYCGKYYLYLQSSAPAESFDFLILSLAEYGTPSSLDRSFLTEHAANLPSAGALFSQNT